MAGHGLITEAKKGLGYPRTVAHNEKKQRCKWREMFQCIKH